MKMLFAVVQKKPKRTKNKHPSYVSLNCLVVRRKWADDMKSVAKKRPTDIVKGNIFDALGFSASEASALKIMAEILSALLEHLRAKGYTQAQLVDILDEYQPSVRNLLKGRISQVSIEELLCYADQLHLQASIAVRPIAGRSRRERVRVTANASRPARKLAAAV